MILRPGFVYPGPQARQTSPGSLRFLSICRSAGLPGVAVLPLRISIPRRRRLVIAHRLATLLVMDRILVFDAGHIVEDGTHEELVRRNGMYAMLWRAQEEK